MRGRARGRASVSRLLGIVTYALTRRHCLSHSLHSPHPPSAARRKAAAGEEVSQPRPVCRSAGRSVDGSWPFICIANYENETERGGGRGEEARTTRRERRCAPAFVARCQLHNWAAAAADRRSRVHRPYLLTHGGRRTEERGGLPSFSRSLARAGETQMAIYCCGR